MTSHDELDDMASNGDRGIDGHGVTTQPPSSSSLAPARPEDYSKATQPRPILRTPLAARVPNSRQNGDAADKRVTIEDAGRASGSQDTPLQRRSLAQSWKVPEVPKRPRVSTRPLSDDEDEPPSGSLPGPSQPAVALSQTWRTPMKRKDPPVEVTDSTNVEAEAHDFDLIDDVPSSPQPEAEKESSQLPPPAWIQHRVSFGLDKLDERLAHQTEAARIGFPYEDAADSHQAGLVRGGLMEIAGTPGSGKTSMAMQLAVRERIASLLHEYRILQSVDDARSEASSTSSDEGLSSATISEWDRCKETSAHAVLIDTEGSISAQRMAGIVVEESKAARRQETLPVSLQTFIEGVLEGLHICRCITLHEFFATLELLAPLQIDPEEKGRKDGRGLANGSAAPTQNSQNPRAQEAATNLDALRLSKMLPSHISLVIIDSVSYYFRAPVQGQHESPARRERALQLAFLRAFVARARKAQPGLRIVATNQMALTFINPASGDRVRLTDERGRGCLQPSLALRAWVPEDVAEQHAWQLLLFREGRPSGRRFAQIVSRPRALQLRNHQYVHSEHAAAAASRPTLDEAYWRTWLPFHIDAETSLLRAPIDGSLAQASNEDPDAAERAD